MDPRTDMFKSEMGGLEKEYLARVSQGDNAGANAVAQRMRDAYKDFGMTSPSGKQALQEARFVQPDLKSIAAKGQAQYETAQRAAQELAVTRFCRGGPA